ncbi:hypothetical protein BJ165DRAFT_364997 [Panaeolus papilionaceus]|nr:hypothetical protein BJ165DRAFT_364997 [Panaeolus papilionaceus]
MKYIRDLRHQPDHRLESILQDTIPQNDRPYAELDALYLYILRQTQYPALVHQILAFRIVTVSFAGDVKYDSRDYLKIFLRLPISVQALMVDLQSIINFDIDGMGLRGGSSKIITFPNGAIPSIFHHASLLEFLLNPQRSEEFYVDIPHFDDELCKIALKHVGDLSSDADEQYIVYCFLILLQTEASLQPAHRGQMLAALSSWDSLNNYMLYDILDKLAPRIIPDELLDPRLWNAFAPAVARKRIQCQQDLERAGLPPEMLVLYEHDLLIYGPGHTRDLPENATITTFHFLGWHLFTSIQNDTEADPWDFFCFNPPRSFRRYSRYIWRTLAHKVLDQSGHMADDVRLDLERQKNNSLEASAAAAFCIRHITSV